MNHSRKSTVRLGVGAGYAGDRLEPGVAVLEQGNVDYLIFECLAERTIALAQQAMRGDPSGGYNDLLHARMRATLATCIERKIPIITNMGAANPLGAAQLVKNLANELNLHDVKVAAVTGDDILPLARTPHYLSTIEKLPFAGQMAEQPGGIDAHLVSANAYLGTAPVVAALRAGADVVITGRVADPVLFLAPLIHEFGWEMDEWDKLGQGTIIGHLLECSGQVTGGYFADPGYKDVPDLGNIGYPIAEVSSNGDAIITKLESTGGCVTEATVKEQLLYEIHDPANYFQPDVIADFTGVEVTQLGKDKVLVKGGRGKPYTPYLKVTLGFLDGYIGEGQITYAGLGSVDRAMLAKQVLEQRLETMGQPCREIRFDMVGINSLFGTDYTVTNEHPAEVRLRLAVRTFDEKQAIDISREFETLWALGPAAGGGTTRNVREILAIDSFLVPRDEIFPDFTILD